MGRSRDHFLQHLDALFHAEQRPLFVVAENGDDQAVEQSRAALDQIQVAVRDGIEGAGVEGHNRGGFRSQGGSVSELPDREMSYRQVYKGCMTQISPDRGSSFRALQIREVQLPESHWRVADVRVFERRRLRE